MARSHAERYYLEAILPGGRHRDLRGQAEPVAGDDKTVRLWS